MNFTLSKSLHIELVYDKIALHFDNFRTSL